MKKMRNRNDGAGWKERKVFGRLIEIERKAKITSMASILLVEEGKAV